MTVVDDVREFHSAMGLPVADELRMLTVPERRLRLALILEEVGELAEALGSDGHTTDSIGLVIEGLKFDTFTGPVDIIEAADALADTQYVVAGTAVEMGVPLSDVHREVHASNMRKRDGGRDANGKWQKPKGWTPPDVAGVLARCAGVNSAPRSASLARAIGEQAAVEGAAMVRNAFFDPLPYEVDGQGCRVETGDVEQPSRAIGERSLVVGDRVEVTDPHTKTTRLGYVKGLDSVAVDVGGVVWAVAPGDVRVA
jgi:predicted HAD superfamily Cof-like phosphohydrolase